MRCTSEMGPSWGRQRSAGKTRGGTSAWVAVMADMAQQHTCPRSVGSPALHCSPHLPLHPSRQCASLFQGGQAAAVGTASCHGNRCFVSSALPQAVTATSKLSRPGLHIPKSSKSGAHLVWAVSGGPLRLGGSGSWLGARVCSPAARQMKY